MCLNWQYALTSLLVWPRWMSMDKWVGHDVFKYILRFRATLVLWENIWNTYHFQGILVNSTFGSPRYKICYPNTSSLISILLIWCSFYGVLSYTYRLCARNTFGFTRYWIWCPNFSRLIMVSYGVLLLL
jgi:hypothetical protein